MEKVEETTKLFNIIFKSKVERIKKYYGLHNILQLSSSEKYC